MWPMILGMSRDECKRILRRLELEAYASLVSALRAQGELSSEKRKLLQDIATTLNISMERHRAEVRRAVNDEKLATIAEHMAGPNTDRNWTIEGRRLMPLMPRLVPQTAFTALANNVANIAAAENSKLPPPSETVKLCVKNGNKMPSPNHDSKIRLAVATGGTDSPCNEPSFVKFNEEEENTRKRRRSSVEKTEIQTSTIIHPPTKIAAVIQSALPASSQTKLSNKLSLNNHKQQDLCLQQKPQQPVMVQQQVVQYQNSQPPPQKLVQLQASQGPAKQPLHEQQQQNQQGPQMLQQQQQQVPQTLNHHLLPHHNYHQQQQQLQPTPSPQLQYSQQHHHQQQQQQQHHHQQQILHISQSHHQHHTHQEQQKQQSCVTNHQQSSHQQHQQQKQLQLQQQQQHHHHQQQHHQQQQHLHQQQLLPQALEKQEHHTPHLPSQQQKLHHQQQPATPKTESYPANMPPVKITLTAASSRLPVTSATTSAASTPTATQKVIIMSSSGAPGSPSILQRSLSVPVVKTVSACGSPNIPQRSSSLVLSGQTHSRSPASPPGSSTVGNIVTISTSSSNSVIHSSSGTTVGASTTTFIAQSTGTKFRTKAVQLPARIRTRPAGSIIIPMTPNQVPPPSGMKMMSMSSISSNAKILPKPVVTPVGPSPVYVMTSATGGSLVTRTSSSNTISRMVTINTAATPHSNIPVPDVRATPTTVITKNVSKPLQTVHISGPSGAVSKGIGGKPNVILVQKPASSTLSRSITLPHGGKGNVIVLDLNQEQISKTTTLSDILRVSGILQDGSALSESVSIESDHGERIVQHNAMSEAHTPSMDSDSHLTEDNETVHKTSASSDLMDDERRVCEPYDENISPIMKKDGRESVEMIGELDPQTGIYSYHTPHSSEQGNRSWSADTVDHDDTVSKCTVKSMDIFRTAIASAELDLESYNYSEGENYTTEEENETEHSKQHSNPNNNNSINIDTISSQGGCTFVRTTQHSQDHDFQSFLHQNGSTTVASVFVEPTNIDTSDMHIEDFTSQKIHAHEVA